ncbi:N-formylglutamate deformylase [Roseovarius ramblicola]|uniref:N-formylglutamate deformylase n=1 Tax=Roseovarius ramblicola TaxID=2022336 RepID=A0ABV5I1D5_9RHOB
MIEVVQGNGPLVLGFPHTGTYVPPEIAARLNATGRTLADTDWHVERLYDGLVGDVTTVRTPVHRYVIDVNRAPDGESLYPGQNTTGLIPLTNFDGDPIWHEKETPDAAEVEARRVAYHAPYHAALTTEMERVRARHGFAVLYDCHSIRSRIPYLFDGVLPDLNIGTNGGATCAPGIETSVQDACAASGYTTVTNGRFKGGWTTRHYGRPDEGLHAIQMELAQSTYLAAEVPPWTYDDARATRLRATLRAILDTLSDWRP